MRIWAVVLVAALSGGCLGISDTGPGLASDATVIGAHEDLDLADCDLWYGSFSWPAGSNPAANPPGWEPKSPVGSSSTYYDFYNCTSLSLGDLKRGPIQIIVELSTAGAPPGRCVAKTNGLDPFLITQVWLDDEELLEQLRHALDWPVASARIDMERDQIGSKMHDTMTWRVEGFPDASRWQSIHDPVRSADPETYQFVYFWDNGETISSMAVNWTRTPSYGNEEPREPARFHAPTAPATLVEGMPHPLGLGHSALPTMTSTHQRYAGYACQA